MGDLFIDIIYDLLKDKNLYNYSNAKELKDTDIKIYTYYDIENIKHIKIDLGFETYTVSVD